MFDGAEELDVVGPYEVLAYWSRHSELRPEVVTFSLGRQRRAAARRACGSSPT